MAAVSPIPGDQRLRLYLKKVEQSALKATLQFFYVSVFLFGSSIKNIKNPLVLYPMIQVKIYATLY
jgi:hypothetical protein